MIMRKIKYTSYVGFLNNYVNYKRLVVDEINNDITEIGSTPFTK